MNRELPPAGVMIARGRMRADTHDGTYRNMNMAWSPYGNMKFLERKLAANSMIDSPTGTTSALVNDWGKPFVRESNGAMWCDVVRFGCVTSVCVG